MCVPDDAEVKRLILEKGHKSRLSLHPIMTKKYQDLKETFWWQGMKKGCSLVRISLSNLSKGKGGASETPWDPTTLGDTSVEMG